jgi:hypothetical protein
MNRLWSIGNHMSRAAFDDGTYIVQDLFPTADDQEQGSVKQRVFLHANGAVTFLIGMNPSGQPIGVSITSEQFEGLVEAYDTFQEMLNNPHIVKAA